MLFTVALSLILSLQLRIISAFDTYPAWDDDFDHKTYVTPDENFLIYWTADVDECTVEFGIIVESEGWAAIGISQTGGMSKSDIVMGYIDDNGTAKVIYAWNDNLPFGYHGANNRGTEAMNLLSGDSMEIPLPEDAAYVDVVQPNVEVPAVDTSYWCTLLKLPEFDEIQHIVRIDPMTQDGNEGIVHHHVVNICPVKYFDEEYLNRGFDCDEYANMPTNASHCRSGISLFSWAVGGKSFYLPENVGIEMGGTAEDRIQYVLLETHYDNPSEEEGFVDSSGLRFWYTPTRREESAVVVTIFDGFDQWIPPGYVGKNYAFSYDQCTLNGGVPDDGINVIASFHHQHLLGRAGKTRHIRDGVELKPIDVNEAYDFDFQQFVPSQGDIVILPGDEIIVECTVEATERTANTYGGESTRDEMCGVFLMVYPPPKLRIAVSVFDFYEKEEFLNTSIELGYYDPETDVYDLNLNGSAELYEEFVNSQSRYMGCVGADGETFAEIATVPQIEQEYNMSNYVICGIEQPSENDEFDWNVWWVYLIAALIGLCGLCLIGSIHLSLRKLCF